MPNAEFSRSLSVGFLWKPFAQQNHKKATYKTSGSAAGKDGVAFSQAKGVTILTVRQQPFVRVNHYYTQQKSIVYLGHECRKQNPKTPDRQDDLV